MMIEQRNKSVLLDSSGDLRVALAMLVSFLIASSLILMLVSFLIVSSLILIEPSTGFNRLLLQLGETTADATLLAATVMVHKKHWK